MVTPHSLHGTRWSRRRVIRYGLKAGAGLILLVAAALVWLGVTNDQKKSRPVDMEQSASVRQSAPITQDDRVAEFLATVSALNASASAGSTRAGNEAGDHLEAAPPLTFVPLPRPRPAVKFR